MQHDGAGRGRRVTSLLRVLLPSEGLRRMSLRPIKPTWRAASVRLGGDGHDPAAIQGRRTRMSGNSPYIRLTHRRVVRIAWPIVLSNATVPLLGIVDTGVIKQLG